MKTIKLNESKLIADYAKIIKSGITSLDVSSFARGKV